MQKVQRHQKAPIAKSVKFLCFKAFLKSNFQSFLHSTNPLLVIKPYLAFKGGPLVFI